MAPIQFAHDGDGVRSGALLRERSEARLAAFAEALGQRHIELLISEVEKIRSEAALQVAEQCRLLAALSMSVATAEAGRERRFRSLERELRDHVERATPQPPQPLEIPRPRGDGAGSITEHWPQRD